jgi:hypothetical protein
LTAFVEFVDGRIEIEIGGDELRGITWCVMVASGSGIEAAAETVRKLRDIGNPR